MLSKRKMSTSKMESLNTLLIGAILINPDVGTFWNMRRILVELDVLSVDRELHFSKIVLTHKSKSNEAFSYRRWLLKRILTKISENDLHAPLSLLQNELMVVHMASEKSPNNYHSWSHRIWCMENIAACSPSIGDIVYSELNYSQEWINTHVSEHSGYHYRQYLLKLVRSHRKIVLVFESFYNFVIKQLDLINDGEFSNLLVYLLGKQHKTGLLEETNSYINYVSLLLYDLFILVNKLNKLFPEHESLFYHRRFLVYHLLKLAYDYHDVDFQARNRVNQSSINPSDDKNIVRSDVVVSMKSTGGEDCVAWPRSFKMPLNKVESCQLYRIVVNAEKHFVSENMIGICSAVQIELAKRYQKWLKYVIGFE
ncbi:protein prenyltransferase alpha subunit repeat-containing protein 1-B isoform X2 [Anoplophora glabripennis]|nr:protein prenyltransferase alpha subunit repeat-containing protein 1-B isoform X2 [Anoplophora glabripennis]